MTPLTPPRRRPTFGGMLITVRCGGTATLPHDAAELPRVLTAEDHGDGTTGPPWKLTALGRTTSSTIDENDRVVGLGRLLTDETVIPRESWTLRCPLCTEALRVSDEFELYELMDWFAGNGRKNPTLQEMRAVRSHT